MKQSNFFEEQLKQLFLKRPEFSTAKFIGRAVYIDLNGNLKCRIEFCTKNTYEKYECIRLKTFSNVGEVDTLILDFSDYFQKQNDLLPHIWRDFGKYEWYVRPTEAEKEEIADDVCQYIRLQSTFSSR